MILLANTTHLRQRSLLWPISHDAKRFGSVFSSDHSLVSALASCGTVSEVSQIHGSLVKTGLDNDTFSLSKLLASSIPDIGYASSIFGHAHSPNRFMFNTIIRGYAGSDDPGRALLIFNDVRARRILLDQFSFIATLKACGRVQALAFGQGIHGVVLKSGYGGFTDVKNTLLQFYCVCGRVRDGHKVFDGFRKRNDLVSWNTLMGGYLKASQWSMVICLFKQISHGGLKGSVATVLTVLSACGDAASLPGAESVHGHCIRMGFCSELNVVTALIDTYAKVGNVHAGRKVFDVIVQKDATAWNCLIHGYAKNGLLEEAVMLLNLMKEEQVVPNSSTLAGLLSACAASGALSIGKYIHKYVDENELYSDAIVGTALINMYAKCGLLEKAGDVFNRLIDKDVKSWTAMITAYGNHGRASESLRLFRQMQKEGYRPNEVTFLAALTACSHRGLVREAVDCFCEMVRQHGFWPSIEHYGCIIDLLGRAGMLEEAYDLLKRLPVMLDETAWRTLLGACRVHGNIKLGEDAKRTLGEMYGEHPADAILLSCTYAAAGERENPTTEESKEEEMVKEAGLSSIEM